MANLLLAAMMVLCVGVGGGGGGGGRDEVGGGKGVHATFTYGSKSGATALYPDVEDTTSSVEI